MNCPVDQAPLRQHEEGGVGFHYCDDCHGMFFTKERLLGCLRRGVKAEFTGQPRVSAQITIRVIRRECPVCHASVMVDKLLNDIAIDICPGCKGVWLDAGELNKIIDLHRSRRRADKKSSSVDATADGIWGTDSGGDSELVGDVAAAVGDFFGGAGDWLGEEGSSVGEFFSIDI